MVVQFLITFFRIRHLTLQTQPRVLGLSVSIAISLYLTN